MSDAAGAKQDARPLCYCFDVTEADVRRYFEAEDATVEGLVRDTKVGTRCTACLLDLDLVLESCHRSLGNAVEEQADASASGREGRGKFLQALDFTNSIFYVCDGAINTVIRVANYGILFERENTVVRHRYTLFVFSNIGRLTACRRGEIPAFEALEIDLSTIPDTAPQGWVMLSLYPMKSGFRGSNRPYVTYDSEGWSASVHMQPHSMASRRGVRNVNFLAREAGGPLASSLSVFNGGLRSTKVDLDLIDVYGSYKERQTFTLPRHGADIIALDDIFSPPDEAEAFTLCVYSEEPTRKMIINIHEDKSWSVDHFPDFPNAY